jgi:glycerol kinase
MCVPVGHRCRKIQGIGISNQRETTIVWDRNSGMPVYRAIVWQSRQSTPVIEDIIQRQLSSSILHKTGLVPDAYFSASKITWLLNQNQDLRDRAQAGDLLFGTVDSWLLWKMTGQHSTDISNASRTLLFNIHHCVWDQELLDWFNIPFSMLPEVKTQLRIFCAYAGRLSFSGHSCMRNCGRPASCTIRTGMYQ